MGNHIIIKEARCSFPRLYSAEERDGSTFGTGVTLVLEKEKHAATIAQIRAEMKAVVSNEPKLKKSPPPPERLCLRKPDREELEYKPGNLILKANSSRPPVVLEPDGRTLMTEATDKIYSGCFVNAKVEIWGQANRYGRRVNGKLITVQFVPKASDSFDGSYVSPDEAVKGFDSLDDDTIDVGVDDDLGDTSVDNESDDLLA